MSTELLKKNYSDEEYKNALQKLNIDDSFLPDNLKEHIVDLVKFENAIDDLKVKNDKFELMIGKKEKSIIAEIDKKTAELDFQIKDYSKKIDKNVEGFKNFARGAGKEWDNASGGVGGRIFAEIVGAIAEGIGDIFANNKKEKLNEEKKRLMQEQEEAAKRLEREIRIFTKQKEDELKEERKNYALQKVDALKEMLDKIPLEEFSEDYNNQYNMLCSLDDDKLRDKLKRFENIFVMYTKFLYLHEFIKCNVEKFNAWIGYEYCSVINLPPYKEFVKRKIEKEWDFYRSLTPIDKKYPKFFIYSISKPDVLCLFLNDNIDRDIWRCKFGQEGGYKKVFGIIEKNPVYKKILALRADYEDKCTQIHKTYKKELKKIKSNPPESCAPLGFFDFVTLVGFFVIYGELSVWQFMHLGKLAIATVLIFSLGYMTILGSFYNIFSFKDRILKNKEQIDDWEAKKQSCQNREGEKIQNITNSYNRNIASIKDKYMLNILKVKTE